MTSYIFYAKLGIVATFSAAVLLFMNQYDLFAVYYLFSWSLWLSFIVFSLFLFFIASKAAKSENKSLFSQVFLISIMIKMFLSLTYIIAYVLFSKPQDKFFVIPFFITYIIFTIYEVHFLTETVKKQ